MKTGIEAAHNVVDEVEPGQPTRHDLHLGAIVEDWEVALVEVVKFSTKVDGTSVLVIAEEIADATLEGARGVGLAGNHGQELGGDAVVEPRHDGAVILHPIVVALGRGSVHMVAETVLPEDGREGARPGDVIGVVEVDDERDARPDVNPMDNRRSSRFGLDLEHMRKHGLGIGVVGG